MGNYNSNVISEEIKKSDRKEKRYAVATISLCLIVLLIVGGMTVIIDPLFQYHEPLENYVYPITNEGYQNPGIAKSFCYDTIITGSSMMQNNKVEWVNQYIDENSRTVKLTYSGASSGNISKILRTAFESNDRIDRVIVGVDVHLWGSEEASYDLPEYLYNRNLFDDVEYIFNDELIAEYTLPVLLGVTGQEETTTLTQAYWWADDEENISGEDIKAIFRNNMINKEDRSISYENYSLRTLNSLQKNIYPILEEHPNTRFEFVFPPYHIMYWVTLREWNGFPEILLAEEQLLKGLTGYPNARVHFFSLDADIIFDYDNYLDGAHYKSKINEYMIKHIGLGDHAIELEDVDGIMEKLKSAISTYDYVRELGL